MRRLSMFSLILCLFLPAVGLAEPSLRGINSAIGSELVLVKNDKPTATTCVRRSPPVTPHRKALHSHRIALPISMNWFRWGP
jgi:hypothetical protein